MTDNLISKNPAIIETPRLILREVDIEADLDMWTDMMSDEETVRYIGGETLDRAQSWRQIALMIGHMQVRGYCFLAVVEKSSGQFIGRIGPWYPEGWPAPEIGWTLHRDYTRKGYAKEAASACVDYAFNTLGWDKVIHVIAHGNIGSIKTAEAIGSKHIGELESIPGVTKMPCHIYGQDRPKPSGAKS